MAEKQVCDGCQSGQCSTYCNSCEGCNGCNTNCNTSCLGTFCLVSQAFCPSKQYIYQWAAGGQFSFNPCPETTTLMKPGEFDKETWDSILEFVNTRAEVGDATNGAVGGSSVAYSTDANVSPFKASEFIRIANIVGYSYNSSEIATNQKIYGKYFKSLETAANKMKISSSACDDCNTACDCGCDACDGCLSGQGRCCNGGQTSCGDKKCCNESSTPTTQ